MSGRSLRQSRARGSGRAGRAAYWLLPAALLIAAGAVALWLLKARKLDAAVRRALVLQEHLATEAERNAALLRWEEESGAAWRGQRERLVAHVMARFPLGDERVRRLLTHLTDTDFGTREEDWKRWHASTRAPGDGLTLTPLWQAPVSLTSWFSPILAIDGQAYVPGLGRAWDDPGDDADGVIRVDGKTGRAEYLFTPRGTAPHDVLGIAAGGGRLFAATRGGTVYALELDGRVLWATACGARLASVPLAIEATGSPPVDVAIVTETGRLILLDGADGATAWVASTGASTIAGLGRTARDAAPRPLLGAALAAGDFLARGSRQIVVAGAGGEVRAFDGPSGRMLWQERRPAGGVAGVVCLQGSASGAFLPDLEGGLWALRPAERGLSAVLAASIPSRAGMGAVAAPRTITERSDASPAIVVCIAGTDAAPGCVALVREAGVHWRCAVPGTIWGSPAIADLTGDGRSEIVVASFGPDEGKQARGFLTVLSGAGSFVARVTLPAPVHASPVVADVNGDGKLDVLVADTAGVMHAFTCGKSGAVEWGSAGGDAGNTRNAHDAYAYSQAPPGFQARWSPE